MYENPEQAFGGSRRMLGLIESIYAAVQQAELWTGVLDQITETVGGESIAIFAGFPDVRTPDIFAIEKMAPDAWSAYAGYYAAINPIMTRCERMFAVGETWVSERAISDAELEKTEFYNDFFKPFDMHYFVGLRIPLGEFPSAALSCQRAKAKGAFGDHADIVYQTLQPHLQRALLLHHQMETMQARSLGLERALDAHEHAVFGIDEQRCVMLCNAHALALVRESDGVAMKQGRLCCTLGEDNRAFQALLAAVLSGGSEPQSAGGSLLVCRARRPALRMTVSPFPTNLPGRTTPLAALVFFSDPSKAVRSRAAILRALYGLTPTEGRIADLLLEGLEMRDVAQRMRITLETARFHVKRVLAKTGARRQSDLLRLMLSLPAVDMRPV